MARILVVDDDLAIREMVALALEKAGHTVLRAGGTAAARRAFAEHTVDLVISDIYMPGEDGVALLTGVRSTHPSVPVILMTARGSIETATAASRIGAFDYLAKPFDLDTLRQRVAAALSPPSPPGAAAEPGPESMIVGSDPSIVEVYKAVARVAPLAVPVLLLGETGTGKELVARALHRYSPRAAGPFVAINCGALPDTLIESELFGHVRGAFTDARRDRRGALVEADGGTVFLDEIGDISPAFQVKLLRFLQEGVVRPVGAEADVAVDARVVAATHRDLHALIAGGTFRQDLYYRLAGYEIVLPPLRERIADLPLLVDHFRRRAANELGRGEAGAATAEVLAILAAHAWPGNVRELEHVVRRLLIDCGNLADAEAARRLVTAASAPGQKVERTRGSSLDDAERTHIEGVLATTRGNRSAAARLLGVDRKTLLRKLRRFGIDIESNTGGREGS
jgi:DNA-binding NtrC family response regulator